MKAVRLVKPGQPLEMQEVTLLCVGAKCGTSTPSWAGMLRDAPRRRSRENWGWTSTLDLRGFFKTSEVFASGMLLTTTLNRDTMMAGHI